VYQLLQSGAIIRVEDGAIIPQDPANRDYREYEDWTADGNTAQPEAVDLTALRTAAGATVDAAAEAARCRYVTSGAGQAMTYLRKAQQAQAFKDAGYSGAVPALVQAAATGRGLAAQAAADLILATQAAWETIGAAIETARETGKTAVGEAADAGAIQTARETAIAALGAL
jgi:hypothetical protein